MTSISSSGVIMMPQLLFTQPDAGRSPNNTNPQPRQNYVLPISGLKHIGSHRPPKQILSIITLLTAFCPPLSVKLTRKPPRLPSLIFTLPVAINILNSIDQLNSLTKPEDRINHLSTCFLTTSNMQLDPVAPTSIAKLAWRELVTLYQRYLLDESVSAECNHLIMSATLKGDMFLPRPEIGRALYNFMYYAWRLLYSDEISQLLDYGLKGIKISLNSPNRHLRDQSNNFVVIQGDKKKTEKKTENLQDLSYASLCKKRATEIETYKLADAAAIELGLPPRPLGEFIFLESFNHPALKVSKQTEKLNRELLAWNDYIIAVRECNSYLLEAHDLSTELQNFEHSTFPKNFKNKFEDNLYKPSDLYELFEEELNNEDLTELGVKAVKFLRKLRSKTDKMGAYLNKLNDKKKKTEYFRALLQRKEVIEE